MKEGKRIWSKDIEKKEIGKGNLEYERRKKDME
jgi:hypothetical protein